MINLKTFKLIFFKFTFLKYNIRCITFIHSVLLPCIYKEKYVSVCWWSHKKGKILKIENFLKYVAFLHFIFLLYILYNFCLNKFYKCMQILYAQIKRALWCNTIRWKHLFWYILHKIRNQKIWNLANLQRQTKKCGRILKKPRVLKPRFRMQK